MARGDAEEIRNWRGGDCLDGALPQFAARATPPHAPRPPLPLILSTYTYRHQLLQPGLRGFQLGDVRREGRAPLVLTGRPLELKRAARAQRDEDGDERHLSEGKGKEGVCVCVCGVWCWCARVSCRTQEGREERRTKNGAPRRKIATSFIHPPQRPCACAPADRPARLTPPPAAEPSPAWTRRREGRPGRRRAG